MKFQRKIELMSLSSLFLLGLVVAVLCVQQVTSSINKQNLNVVSKFAGLAQQFMEDDLERLDIAAEAMVVNPEVVQAVQRRDVATLKSVCKQIMDAFSVSVISITDERGTVIARGHSDVTGDRLETETVRNALAGRRSRGVEPGNVVSYSLRAAVPIFVNGRNIGAISAGNSNITDHVLVDKMKDILDAECTIFHGDSRISTTIRNSSGERAIGTRLDNTAILRTVLEEGKIYAGDNKIFNNKYTTAYAPIKSPDGEITGMLFLGFSKEYIDTIIMKQIISIIISVAVIVVVITLFQRRVIHGIVRPISEANALLSEVAQGNLTVRSTLRSNDEIGEMAKSLNSTIIELQGSINEIASISDQTASGAVELSSIAEGIADHTQEMDDGAKTQQSILNTTSSNLNNLIADITKACDMTHESAETTNKAIEVASDCREKMDESVKAMQEILDSSEKIGKIIVVISQIARQTNLLSLNAAIEAAKAGQHGRGFAVVADEIRKLAERSANAAQEIASLINESNAKAQTGSRTVGALDTLLAEIEENVRKSANIALVSSKTLVEQVQVGHHAIGSMQSTFEVAQRNADTIKQLTESIHQTNQMINDMARSAETMRNLTRRFTL
ncbi:MAG: methyl-accepting chemotaxis protein [Holophagaceae bacterium]|nr:methyl-accepting chemotaxis protein [Holophagaceae bacterium]